MKLNLLLVGIFALIIGATGCASIVSKSDWPVTFKSNPSGADVLITDKQGQEVHRGITPTTFKLHASMGYFSSADYHVSVKMDGYREDKGEMSAKMNGWYWGNILFGGLIGFLIVDPATGAMYKFSEEYSVNLSKAHGSFSTNGVSESDTPIASGTGFFITDDGYLITNNHVVKDAEKVRLRTSAGLIDATVVNVDVADDLALLKATGKFTSLAVSASRVVKLGGTVATVGFPDPLLQGFAPKLSKGEIASLSGIQDDPHYFQISVPLQPGNSGGALVDEYGNVVGIVAAKLSARAALNATGQLPENVNYAVKSSLLLSFLESSPDVSSKLKEPITVDHKFEDVVKSAQDAAVLVLVY